jgi:hypothetical protein
MPVRVPDSRLAAHKGEIVQLARRLISTCVLVLSIGATGCATRHPYVPSLSRQFEPIPEFSSKNPVAVVNAQSSTLEVEYGNQNHKLWVANLRDWTGAAVAMTERELRKRGLEISKAGQRTLSLAIVTVKRVPVGWTGMETQTVMRAETAAGYSAEYTGKATTYFLSNQERQTDYSFMNAVELLLSDQKIVSYLTQ